MVMIMKNDFENDYMKKETVQEMITELVYLRKVIDNAVYYGTSISIRATHLIDTILYYHDTGIKDEFTAEELEEIIDNMKSGEAEQGLLNLNINHLNNSMANLDSILIRLLEDNHMRFFDASYDEIEEDFFIRGDFYDE